MIHRRALLVQQRRATMHIGLCLVLSLFWFVVEVYSQPTAPYVSFRGVNLPNHGYVDLSLVGDPETSTSSGDAVQCHTDIQPCCSPPKGGISSGDWYFPDGDRLPFSSVSTAGIHMIRTVQRVDLRRRDDDLSPSGIYTCEIQANGDDNIAEIETVYVGIYGSGGNVLIPEGMKLMEDNALNGASPQFTLTCISTGGPATTVTWTRDSQAAVGDTLRTLTNAVSAEYTHTLTVTGRLGGEYTCTVTNDVTPGGASASITVQDPPALTNLKAEAGDDLTSILLTWTPSTGADGYSISYDNGAGSSGTVTVSGGSTESHTLTGLQNGTTYNISIFATSIHFNSDSVQFDPVSLVEEPPIRGGGDGEGNKGDHTGTVVAGVLAPLFILAATTSVLVVGFTLFQRRRATNQALELAKLSRKADPDVIHISSNEAYHTVSQTEGTTTDYETVSDPHTVPPSTTQTTAEDYEPVDPDIICTSSNKAYHTVSQTGGTTTAYETVSEPDTAPPSTSQPTTAGDYEPV